MQPLDIGQLTIGERVQHELLVLDRVEKTHKYRKQHLPQQKILMV